MQLVLKKTGSHYRDGPWKADDDDYVVLNGGLDIGRIFTSPQGRPWFWTITAREYPPTIHGRGYSATREQAMQDFKAQWLQSP
jgi:hypothetical protein